MLMRRSMRVRRSGLQTDSNPCFLSPSVSQCLLTRQSLCRPPYGTSSCGSYAPVAALYRCVLAPAAQVEKGVFGVTPLRAALAEAILLWFVQPLLTSWACSALLQARRRACLTVTSNWAAILPARCWRVLPAILVGAATPTESVLWQHGQALQSFWMLRQLSSSMRLQPNYAWSGTGVPAQRAGPGSASCIYSHAYV